MVSKRLLVIDDDSMLRQTLSEQLRIREEFETYEAATGEAALALLKELNFDIMLMDVGLPDIDGRELCRLIRRQGIKAPIIMLTARDGEADTILGLDAGAYDYITKPFKISILLARLRAHLRQHEQSDDAVFTIGPYQFRPSAKVLIAGDSRKIRLTEKETAILKYLYRAGNQMITRETLLNEVWGYNAAVTTHTLETHVYRLRQKIETDPSNANILVTVTGVDQLRP